MAIGGGCAIEAPRGRQKERHMFFFVGMAVVFGCVFGGYIMAGGKMAPIIKAAPIEGFIIVG